MVTTRKKKIGYIVSGSIRKHRGGFTGYLDTKKEAIKYQKELKNKKGLIWTEEKKPKKIQGTIKNIRIKKVRYRPRFEY